MIPWQSAILRVNGPLNMVNDSVIGGQATIGGRSRYAGQLGKIGVWNQDQIATMFNSAIGTLYAGAYQYVRLAEASEPVIVGQGALWDLTAAVSEFQVIDITTQATAAMTNLAGVFINAITPGNYGFIQILGLATVQLAASLTDTTIGSAIVPVAESSPTDHALFNTINDNSGTADNPNLNAGFAMQAPVAGALCLAQLKPLLYRG